MKKKETVGKVMLFLVLLFILFWFIGILLFSKTEEPKKEVVLQPEVSTVPTESDSTDDESKEDSDDTVVFNVSEDALYAKSLVAYDAFVTTLFLSNSFSLDVNKDIEESVKSQISAIAPESGYISRQADIKYSGLNTEEGVDKYIAIVDVFCLDASSKQYKYTIIVKASILANVVSDFNLSMF